ncbi:MAG: pantoate--beta-alanine ligase [Bacteroidia bacterium]
MKTLFSARQLADFCQASDREIAFVPTMGALHEGHLELLRQAQSSGALTIVSVFVNPLQFNNPEDLDKYPRTLERDSELLTQVGADVLFVPSVGEMYPEAPAPSGVDLGGLDTRWEGSFRPGHFEGVLQVLDRLFHIVSPKRVYFGQKDLQQCMVVRKLIEQKFSGIEMVTVPTVRAESGLALSSRNARLSPDGLLRAAEIHRQLKRVSQALAWDLALQDAEESLFNHGIETEYLAVVELTDMLSCPKAQTGHECAVVFSGYLEVVRLIDNLCF